MSADSVIDAIVAAVAAGAAAGLKEDATRALRDAYGAVRAALASRYPRADLAAVEAEPASPEGRSALAGQLAGAGAAGDADLLRLAIDLAAAVGRDAPREAVADVTLRDLEARFLSIQGVHGKSARVRVERARTRGGITIGDVRAEGGPDPNR